MIKFILSEKFILPIVYVVMGVIIYTIIRLAINKISKRKHIDKKRLTIISLVKNIIKYIVCILVVLAILSVYGVDTTSILASIGIVGVIIGLALQDTVKDFLAGVCIIFDNEFSLGDTISISGFTGEVVGFGLISTKVKAATGEVKIISNSLVKEVINYSVNNSSIFIKLDVSYDTDIDKLENILKKMEDKVSKIEGYVGGYKLLGIDEYASSSIVYMVTFNVTNNKRIQAKRDYLKLIRDEFIKEKIEIPYSKLDLYIKEK